MAGPSSILGASKRPAPKLKTEDSSKSLPNLLYKIAFVAVFAALLPLFPSQAPEFISESMFTGVWELLHLLFVGIAVSYGLFSRRNADPESAKEPPPKEGSPRSFVSHMLHDSLGFGDEEEEELGSPIEGVHAWSSQYQRSEPSTRVAGVGSGTAEQVSSKHQLLPVRSLKAQDQDARSGSTDSVVLPSPIPWKSRTGVVEIKKEVPSRPSSSTLPPRPSFDAEEVVSKAKIPHLPSSPHPPPLKNRVLSPSPSSEVRSKGGGNAAETKTTYKFILPPAPPPPPPPPPPGHLGHGYGFPSTPERRVAERSFKEELKYRHNTNHTLADPPVSNQRSHGDCASSVGRSVRTARPKEVQQTPATDGGKRTSFEARLPPPVPEFTTQDSDSDDAEEVGQPPAKEETSSSAEEAGIHENEVDKKADEFIAKFREQIRLQRIESIKRSTKQRSNRKKLESNSWQYHRDSE